MEYCYSCGMPLVGEDAQKAKGHLCQYCTDEAGNLKPRDEVAQGIAMWLKGWSPKASDEEFKARAESYMNAMPAWQKS